MNVRFCRLSQADHISCFLSHLQILSSYSCLLLHHPKTQDFYLKYPTQIPKSYLTFNQSSQKHHCHRSQNHLHQTLAQSFSKFSPNHLCPKAHHLLLSLCLFSFGHLQGIFAFFRQVRFLL